MKNILKYSSILGFLFLFLTSCGSDDSKPVVPEISGIENTVKILEGKTGTYNLTGGDGDISAKSQNEGIATATIDGNTLIITGVSAGKTNITINAGSKVKVVEVDVVGKTAGIYKNGMLETAFSATVSSMKGLWLLEKSGNPYDGKRLFLPLFRGLEKGNKLNIEVKSFGIDEIPTKVQIIDVEDVLDDIVVLKFENATVIIPKM